MKVQFNPNFLYNSNQKNTRKVNKNSNVSYSHNPMFYKDYNISFGTRLFRTPENFYEQDFNKNGMPKTLHRYIYAPSFYDFRKTIPPAQAMKEVFGVIADMQTLEEVKAYYPDEPLFKDLHSKSSLNARTGVLGELALMKKDAEYQNKSLFKNGDDDLGMYIVRKIYIEGKTLKEINKDFQKDKSVAYNGLSDIQYSDLKAFGIHFPKVDFWKSFVATREDFPYVYIPRKTENINVNRINNRGNSFVNNQPRASKKIELKNWEIDKISDAIISVNGDKENIVKQLRKRNIQDPEKLNFVAKYMGEINSIVLEKLHISEDMKDYFENYSDLSKSQKDKFRDYWHIPDADNIRSKVMSSTIRLFFDVYGVDGNNEDFQELLAYARNIKSDRLQRAQEHAKLQAEYDEMFANIPEDVFNLPEDASSYNKDITEINEGNTNLEGSSFNNLIEKEAKEKNAKIFEFKLDDGTPINILSNLPELLKLKIESENTNLPKSYSQKLIKAYLNHPLVSEDYLLSTFYNTENLEQVYNFVVENEALIADKKDEYKKEVVDSLRSQLMPNEETDKITAKVYSDFEKDNKMYLDTVKLLMMEVALNYELPSDDRLFEMLDKQYEEYGIKNALIEENLLDDEDISFDEINKNVSNSLKVLNKDEIVFLSLKDLKERLLIAGFTELSPEQNRILEKRINKFYKKPIDKREKARMVENVSKQILADRSAMPPVIRAALETVHRHPVLLKHLNSVVSEFVDDSHGAELRYFNDPNADKKLLKALSKLVVDNISSDNSEFFIMLASIDKDVINDFIRPYDYTGYINVENYRKMSTVLYKLTRNID